MIMHDYKGFDIDITCKKDLKKKGIMNPYGYNLESYYKKDFNYESVIKTSQDSIFPVVQPNKENEK